MTRRDHAVIAVLVLLLVALGGALALPRPVRLSVGGEATPGQTPAPPVTYREGVVGAPSSILPVAARTRSERTLVGLVFSGLIRLGPENSFEGDLAASWTIDPAGLVWTFTIRDDATWQDGEPVTAEDVVYTVGVLKSPDAAGPAASSWAEVSATALDAKTVQLTLATPIPGFLEVATQPLLPAHLLAGVPYADLAGDPFARQPVGSGPYALTELTPAMAVLTPAALVRPSRDSGPQPSPDSLASPARTAPPASPVPYLERIEIHFYADVAALAAAFTAGQVDAASGLPEDQLASLADTPGTDRVRYPTTTLSAAILNQRPTHPELRDPRVRRALLAGIDRNTLVSTLLAGDALRADALVPPGSWAWDASAAASVAFDRKAAASLLKAAGWKKIGGSWATSKATTAYRLEVLTVPAEANPRLAAVAGYVRDAWTALGFQVDFVQVPAAELATRLRAGTYGAAIVDIAMGLEPDLYSLLASTQVRAVASNLSGYQDTALDPLLEAARAPGTPEARSAAWKVLLAALAERQPILPLAWQDEVVLVRGVDGITPRLITGPGDRFWDVLAWRLAANR